MDWGNAIVRSKTTDASGKVTAITMDLHLAGDFRKTKKKITWLAAPSDGHKLADATLLDYDYLITKKKLEEEKKVDSTVFEYDEVWDKMQEAKLRQKEAKEADAKERKVSGPCLVWLGCYVVL